MVLRTCSIVQGQWRVEQMMQQQVDSLQQQNRLLRQALQASTAAHAERDTVQTMAQQLTKRQKRQQWWANAKSKLIITALAATVAAEAAFIVYQTTK